MKNKVKCSRSFYKIILNLLFISCIVVPSSAAIPARVLPEFSGDWYTDVSIKNFDACNNPVLKYNNKMSGSSEALAKKLLNEVPIYSYCQWGDTHVSCLDHHDSDSIPIGFTGTQGDWEKILLDPKSPRRMHWERHCKDNKGIVFDSREVVIEPDYSCPVNSRIGVDTNTLDDIGCLNPPQPCLADIVGRDLNVPILGFLGHVGLVQQNYTDEIIEVLQKPKDGIYINLLKNFKNIPDAPYWGEKHGLADEKDMGIEKARSIMDIATAQSEIPLEYTLGWDYHPGKIKNNVIYNQQEQRWQMIDVTKKALFRCDSFVYYSYSVGGKLNIFPEFKAPLFPTDMFNRFISCRDNEGKHCSVKDKHTDTPHDSAPTDKYQLQSVFAGHILDIRQADYSTYTYVHDVNIPRAVKVNQLWSLAIRHQDNPAKFSYLVDIMGSLKPIELVPEIIQTYQHQTDTSNQHHLLSLLDEILDLKNQSDLNADEQLTNIIKIQNFFRDLLYQCKNPDILKYAIQLYPSIVSPSDAERDIQYALSRQDIKKIYGNILNEKELIMTELNVAFLTRDQQKKLLPQLIQKYKENRQFYHSLCFMLSHMSPDKIDNSIKEKLANLLERQRDKLMEPTINQMLETQKNPESDWFIAYAAVKTHSETEKERFILNYIHNEPDIFMQAGLVSQVDWRLADKLFSAKDKAYYRQRFFDALYSPTFRQDKFDPRSSVLKLGISIMSE